MAKALKPGDKVSFLNEAGGGKVLSIIDENQVLVELDEGFEIPVPESQLVKVQDFTKEQEVAEEVAETEPAKPQKPKGEPGLYLAFDPAKGGDMLEVYLVNNTAYELYFTIFEASTASGYFGISRGELESLGNQMIKRVNQSDFSKWRPLIIQALPFANALEDYPQPLHLEFKPKPKSFFKALKYMPLLDREVYLFKVGQASTNLDQPPSNRSSGKEQETPAANKKADEKEPANEVIWAEIPPHTVDLHIEKLVKNSEDWAHSEILEYQMKCFEHALDRGLAWGYDRMVFIHGIGNGVLRERIHLYLKRFPSVNKFKEGPQPGTTEIWL